METDWQHVYSTNKLYNAEIVKDILEDNSIKVVLMNKQDSFYLFGDIELYVKPEDVIKAKHLIKDIE